MMFHISTSLPLLTCVVVHRERHRTAVMAFMLLNSKHTTCNEKRQFVDCFRWH